MAQIMTTRLEVQQGCLERFYDVMGNVLIPLLDRNMHQKLLAGYKTVIGPSNHEILHIWEVEDANACMSRSKLLSADPEFPQMIAMLQPLVVREGFSLVTKTPYSP